MAKESINFEDYQRFVDSKTSDTSSSYDSMLERFKTLREEGLDIERFITSYGAMGSEFLELLGQKNNTRKIKYELGDILWYLVQGCYAVNYPLHHIVKNTSTDTTKNYDEAIESLAKSVCEYIEISKKILFQGKPFKEKLPQEKVPPNGGYSTNEEYIKMLLNRIFQNICKVSSSIESSIEEVIALNYYKLDQRYPKGFEQIFSEIRPQDNHES